jgi:hypothetical protein
MQRERERPTHGQVMKTSGRRVAMQTVHARQDAAWWSSCTTPSDARRPAGWAMAAPGSRLLVFSFGSIVVVQYWQHIYDAQGLVRSRQADAAVSGPFYSKLFLLAVEHSLGCCSTAALVQPTSTAESQIQTQSWQLTCHHAMPPVVTDSKHCRRLGTSAAPATPEPDRHAPPTRSSTHVCTTVPP